MPYEHKLSALLAIRYCWNSKSYFSYL